MIKVEVNGVIYERENPLVLEDLANELGIKCYACKVDNRLRELSYSLTTNAKLEYLDMRSRDSMLIYNASFRFLMCMAIKNIYNEAKVIFNNSISRSIFCEIQNIGPISVDIVKKIDKEIRRLISLNLPINRTRMTKDEAREYYIKTGQLDKVKLLEYRPESVVHLYECDGYINYMYSYMVPNTSYLKDFNLKLYAPGIIIQLPRAECSGDIPEFEDAKTFSQVLRDSANWGKRIGCENVYSINKMIEEGNELELINLCETKHNIMLSQLGQNIHENIDHIRLIAVAGPSSSGKTTFTNRLRMELLARGIKPLMISIDNYYNSKEEAPLDEDGNPDLEHIEALDIDLFNKQMFALINGEEVTLPYYDFELGKRVWGETVKLEGNSPILIEGIHALNDDLTPSIPIHKKYKIYIAPQSQLHLDDENPLSLTDLRLIRRLVRDKKFRNAKAIETLEMWPSVRRGEFRWIYKNQEGVNYVFNSELTYELCVLKKYALPLLKEISSDSPYYIQANRLIKVLKYFKDIEDEWIPSNSIIREFIGHSIFYRK